MVSDAPELSELLVLEELCDLFVTHASSLLHVASPDDRDVSQIACEQYASSLAYIPRILRSLHDYARFASDLHSRSDAVLTQLSSLRASSDALSSEEQRVLVSTASVSDFVSLSIAAMEDVLSLVRSSSHALLTLIAYDGDDFSGVFHDLFPKLNTSLIASRVHEQSIRVSLFAYDVRFLHSLENHITELSQ